MLKNSLDNLEKVTQDNTENLIMEEWSFKCGAGHELKSLEHLVYNQHSGDERLTGSFKLIEQKLISSCQSNELLHNKGGLCVKAEREQPREMLHLTGHVDEKQSSADIDKGAKSTNFGSTPLKTKKSHEKLTSGKKKTFKKVPSNENFKCNIPFIEDCIKIWKNKFDWLTCTVSDGTVDNGSNDQSSHVTYMLLCNECKSLLFTLRNEEEVFKSARSIRDHSKTFNHSSTSNKKHQVYYQIYSLLKTISPPATLDQLKEKVSSKFNLKSVTDGKDIVDIAKVIIDIAENEMHKILKLNKFSVAYDPCRKIMILRVLENNCNVVEYLSPSVPTEGEKMKAYLLKHEIDYKNVVFLNEEIICEECEICKHLNVANQVFPLIVPCFSNVMEHICEVNEYYSGYFKFICILIKMALDHPDVVEYIPDFTEMITAPWWTKNLYQYLCDNASLMLTAIKYCNISESNNNFCKYIIEEDVIFAEVLDFCSFCHYCAENQAMTDLNLLKSSFSHLSSLLESCSGNSTQAGVLVNLEKFVKEITKEVYIKGRRSELLHDITSIFYPIIFESLTDEKLYQIYKLFESHLPFEMDLLKKQLKDFGSMLIQTGIFEYTIQSIFSYFNSNETAKITFNVVYELYKLMALLPIFPANRNLTFLSVDQLKQWYQRHYGEELGAYIFTIREASHYCTSQQVQEKLKLMYS